MRLNSKLAAIGLIWIFMFFLPVGCNKKTNQANAVLQIKALQTNSDASLRGLFVFDENVIWASGSGGKVLRSKDGGKNWKFVAENGFYTFRAIPGKIAGFAAGSDGRISRFDFTE